MKPVLRPPPEASPPSSPNISSETLTTPTTLLKLTASVVDLSNTILGTGLLSLPYAFATTGLIPATFLVVLACASTWFSLHLLVTAAQHAHGVLEGESKSLESMHGEPSFSSLGEVLLSKWGGIVADIAVLLSCTAFSISYLVSIGDAMPKLVAALLPEVPVIADRYLWMLGRCLVNLVFMVLILPLSLARTVDDFSWFSSTALGAALFLAFTILFSSLYLPYVPPIWVVAERKSFECIPIFAFSFVCHANLFTFYKDINATYPSPLAPSTLSHIASVIDFSLLSVGIGYMIIGWVGFLTFGADTSMIVLDNYPQTPIILLARLAYALLAALSVPIQLHPSRTALESLLTSLELLQPSGYVDLETHTPKDERGRRWLISLVLLGVTVAAAVVVPDLETILALVGATGGIIMCYILPTVFFSQCGIVGVRRGVAWVIVAIGCLCGGAQICALVLI